MASDASALIEHTDRVIYLEDDDVASIYDGSESSSLPPLITTIHNLYSGMSTFHI